MELNEDLKYRLAFLTMRLAFDRKLSEGDPGRFPAMLRFLKPFGGSELVMLLRDFPAFQICA